MLVSFTLTTLAGTVSCYFCAMVSNRNRCSFVAGSSSRQLLASRMAVLIQFHRSTSACVTLITTCSFGVIWGSAHFGVTGGDADILLQPCPEVGDFAASHPAGRELAVWDFGMRVDDSGFRFTIFHRFATISSLAWCLWCSLQQNCPSSCSLLAGSCGFMYNVSRLVSNQNRRRLWLLHTNLFPKMQRVRMLVYIFRFGWMKLNDALIRRPEQVFHKTHLGPAWDHHPIWIIFSIMHADMFPAGERMIFGAIGNDCYQIAPAVWNQKGPAPPASLTKETTGLLVAITFKRVESRFHDLATFTSSTGWPQIKQTSRRTPLSFL